MAGVFLSYDRDDTAVARVIATALEKAGHSVWWDLHVRGGAQFAKVIEEALKAADAVVVLWSRESVDSAWVRDEAAAGRDSGRLIPASIDGTEPPLGFRQFQTIDLSDWKRGSRSRGYKLLEHALMAVLETQPATSANVGTGAPVASGRQRVLLLSGFPIAAAAALAAYFLWPSSPAAVPTVTVVPASSGAASQALSRDLLAKLGILQASNSNSLQLVEQGSGRSPDLLFKVDASDDAGAARATLTLLSGKTHALLWSGDFDQPSGNRGDLKQQLAYSAANVLDCASDAYGPNGRSLDPLTRQRYLRACGDFSQVTAADLERLTAAFRDVTRRAPGFARAWEQLLYADMELLYTPPFDRDTPAAEARVHGEVAAARKLNPDMAAAYFVESEFARGGGSLLQSISLLERSADKNPDDPDALAGASTALLQVGRMKDAVALAWRAVQIKPFSPRTQEALVSALAYSGQLDAARKELSKSEALFPGASNVAEVRFRLDLRYGSPQAVLQDIQQGQRFAIPGQETYLKARSDPTAANVDAAIESARQHMDPNINGTYGNYIQILGEFGRKDQLFDFLSNWHDLKHLGWIGVIFRPPFHELWRDPKSMRIAANFGFVRYWKDSGHWPDFCSWPDLPYDCKKEAAKLAA